jgi:hypothetical protein
VAAAGGTKASPEEGCRCPLDVDEDEKPERNKTKNQKGFQPMPLITVSQGGPEIEPGVYPVILVAIEGPKTIIPQGGPNAGQEIEIFDWSR